MLRVPRALIAYLVCYYVVIAAAVVTLWRSGLIAHMDRTWTGVVIALSVMLGVMLAVFSRK